MTFSCCIEDLFDRWSYSKLDLCRSVGITPRSYYRIISGESMPRVDIALRICDYLSKNTNWGRKRYKITDLWKIEP